MASPVHGNASDIATASRRFAECARTVRSAGTAARSSAAEFTTGGAWGDASGRAAAERLNDLAGRIERAAAQLDALSERAATRARAYSSMGAGVGEGSESAVIRGSVPSEDVRDPAQGGPPASSAEEVASFGPTGEEYSRRGNRFEVWSFRCVDPWSFDWGADPRFPEHFPTEIWKGHPADDYRALTALAPTLLAHCRVTGPDDVPAELALARDAYFGTEHVRLEVADDGRISVGAGRHRLMAAIEAGASIPVTVWRASPG